MCWCIVVSAAMQLSGSVSHMVPLECFSSLELRERSSILQIEHTMLTHATASPDSDCTAVNNDACYKVKP